MCEVISEIGDLELRLEVVRIIIPHLPFLLFSFFSSSEPIKDKVLYMYK